MRMNGLLSHGETRPMNPSGYDFVSYQPEFRPQVINLMRFLWGSNTESNGSYFKWKYEDNPFTESPLGMVALQREEVVGFRGYFAVRLEVSGKNIDFIALFPGDTCVHPDHRRSGLSVTLGHLAIKEYATRYPLFFNTSCTKNSLPGYRKMGFFPVAPKVYLTRSSFYGLINHILASRENLPLSASPIRFGQFDKILVSKQPKPEAMSLLVAEQKHKGSMIRLSQDEDFFKWRFCNPLNKYIFYYLMEEDIPVAYVVMGISPNNRRGYVPDYAGKESSSVREILEYIIQSKPLNLLSIYNFCLDDALRQSLKSLGFRTYSLVRLIERTLHGELPLLVRPVKETLSESDFFIGGLDSRKIGNWSLKPICSDAA